MKVPTLGLCVVLLISSLAVAGVVKQPTASQPGVSQPGIVQPYITQPSVDVPAVYQPAAHQDTPAGVPVTASPIATQVYPPTQPVVGQVSAPPSVATACGCGQQH